MTTEKFNELKDSTFKRDDLSEIEEKRIEDGYAIHQLLESMPNVPEKIFEKFDLSIITIDNVLIEGSGFKRVFTWNGKTYKRPELVAKAYYEQQGYMVTWSEGVAWGIVIKALEKIFCVEFGKYFNLIDDRDQQLEKLFGMISRKRFHPDQFSDKEGDDKYKKIAEKQVNDEYTKRFNKINGIEGQCELRLLDIAQSIFDKDEVAFNKFIKMSKLECKNSFKELNELMNDLIINLQKNIKIECLEIYFPKVGDIIFNAERDKYNLNEWSIQFAKDLLLKLSWVDVYNKHFASCRNFITRFDLTLIGVDTNEVKFVEVKVDDSFTMFQKMDLVNSIQYNINIELAVIN